MRRTNGTPKRAGYLLTVWFNELGFTGLEGNTAILWISTSPLVVVDDQEDRRGSGRNSRSSKFSLQTDRSSTNELQQASLHRVFHRRSPREKPLFSSDKL